jgi:hypothetical protein
VIPLDAEQRSGSIGISQAPLPGGAEASASATSRAALVVSPAARSKTARAMATSTGAGSVSGLSTLRHGSYSFGERAAKSSERLELDDGVGERGGGNVIEGARARGVVGDECARGRGHFWRSTRPALSAAGTERTSVPIHVASASASSARSVRPARFSGERSSRSAARREDLARRPRARR